MSAARLHPDDLERLADLVADRLAVALQPKPEPVLLTAQQVADRFGLSAEWVRDNAAELGVVRIGNGKRPRLRFEAEKVVSALTARTNSEKSQRSDSPVPAGKSGPFTPAVTGSDVAGLPVRELQPRRTRKKSPGGVGAPRGMAHGEVTP